MSFYKGAAGSTKSNARRGRRAAQLEVDISGFPNVAAHLKQHAGTLVRQEAARLRERSE